MTYISYPQLGGGSSGPAEVTFPLVSPQAGAAGQEPFAFATGGGFHGDGSGGVALSSGGTDGLTLSPQGAVGVPGTLSAQGLATLAGGLTTADLTASSATVSGNASVGGGLGVAGSVQVTGDITGRNITASAALTAASITSQSSLAAQTLQVAGAATLGSLTVQGTFEASAIASDGPLYIPTSGPNAPGVGLKDQNATGIFGAPGTIGLSVAGASVLSLGSGAATFAGNITAPSASLTGLTTSTLTASGASSLQSATIVTLSTSGNTSLGGALTVAGDFTVQGTSRLSNLAIDMLSTDHDLRVGGNTILTQDLSLQGSAMVGGSLAVSGQSSLAGVTATGVALTSLLQPLTDSAYTPVLTVPTSGNALKYTVNLAPNGNLGLSGGLQVLRGASISGALSSGAISAPSAALSGALSAGGDLAVGGAISATGSVTSPSLTLGGAYVGTYPGNPNGHVAASLGGIVLDSSYGMLYVKAGGGSSNTGWAAAATSATALAYPLLLPTSSNTTTPQAAFADDPQTGLGRTAALPLFLAVAGSSALSFDGQGRGTFAKDLTASGALSVAGSAALGALSAGSSTLGATTTQALNATTGAFSGNLSASSLNTGPATVGALSAASAGISGALTAATGAFSGALSSSTSVAAPRVLFSGAALSSGSTAPAGQVSGSPGDLYTEKDNGAAWLKITGTGTTSGWAQVSTSAGGTTFPLAAPNGSAAAPSYGFSQGPLGITALGTNVLAGIVGGQPGWILDAQKSLTVYGDITAASNLEVGGYAEADSITANSGAIRGDMEVDGDLMVQGATTLMGMTAGAISAASLSAQGAVSSGAAMSAGSSVSATTYIASGANQWSSASAAPSGTGGTQGDLVTVTSGSSPLYVRGSSGYVAVALAGSPAPTSFPLLAPLDSASAPSYASARSPDTGVYAPAAKQLGFATAGASAAVVDASQNWAFAAAISATAATLGRATVNGPLSATGAATLGSTLQVTGAATLSSSLTAASASISGALSAATGTISGALSAQTASTTGDVSVGGNLTVAGATTYTGVQKAPYIQLGDGTVSGPSLAFQSEVGLGLYRSAAGTLGFAAGGVSLASLTANLLTLPGALRVGATNAGVVSPGTNQVALQTAGTSALLVDAAQTVSVAAKLTVTGLTTGPTASWTTSSSSPLQLFPETAAPATATTGQLFVKSSDHNLYFLSSAGVTTQVTPATPAFPLLASPDGSVTAPSYSWASETGLGWYRSAAATMVAAGAGNPLATLTTNLLTLPGAVRVGGTNAGLTSAGANLVALQTAGTAALSVDATQNLTASAKLTVTGLSTLSGGATGTTASWSTSTTSPLALFTETTAPATTTTGQLFVKSTDHNLYFTSSTGVTTQLSPFSTQFPLLAPSGTAAAPSYSFSASSSSGLTYIPDAGSGTIPSVSLVANGKVCAFVSSVTANTLPVYSLGIGDPTATSAPYPGGIRVSNQAASGNIAAAVGQLALNPTGSAGSVLAVKESGSGTTSGWALAYTQGSAQIAGQNGTATAPYFSFSSPKTSGLYTDGTNPIISQNGVPAIAFFSGAAGVSAQGGFSFGLPGVAGNPYMFGVPSGTANAGNPITNQLPAYQGALMVNAAGAAGDQLWIHESSTTTNYAAWSRVLTETTLLNKLTFNQTTQPTNVSGKTIIWADANNLVRLGLFLNSSSAPTLKQEIVATLYGATQAITQANNNSTICTTAASQYTLTLPAASSTIDLCYRFQVESTAGVVVKAATGQVINNGGSVSSSGGTLTTTTLGATTELFLRAGTTTWFARGTMGSWTAA